MHSMRRTAIVLAMLTSALGFAPAAQAANSDGVCETKEVCIYMHANLTGSFSDYRYYADNYHTHTFDYQTSGCGICFQNDEVSSMRNKDASWKVRFFVDAYFDGAGQILCKLCIDNQANYNDAYSSHCWNDGGASGLDPDCIF